MKIIAESLFEAKLLRKDGKLWIIKSDMVIREEVKELQLQWSIQGQ